MQCKEIFNYYINANRFVNKNSASITWCIRVVNSHHCRDGMHENNIAMKEMFRDVLQDVMERELDAKLGYEKSERRETTLQVAPKIVGKYSRTADGMEKKI